MFRLLETIRLSKDGYDNILYHSQRMNRARKELFQCQEELDLSAALYRQKTTSLSIEKCRVIYTDKIEKIEFIPYTPRSIITLKLVYDDGIEYSYKYEKRKALQRLFLQRESCDDVLIVKKTHVTDTSFSNIVFFDGEKWITPAHPLLRGTRRQQLLDCGAITEDEISVTSLRFFLKARLINSMLRFDDAPEIKMTHIYP